MKQGLKKQSGSFRWWGIYKKIVMQDWNFFWIRFNNTAQNESERWRLIVDGKEEIHVSSITINCKSWTEMNLLERGEMKWHIVAKGKFTRDSDNNVTIS
jgi:hypothetical protein